MKILIALERLDPERGGLERYAFDLGGRLVSMGLHVSFAAQYATSLPQGAELVRISPLPWPKALRVIDFARKCGQAAAGFDVVHGLLKTWRQHVLHPHTGAHSASLEGLDRSASGPFSRAAGRALRALSLKQAAFRWIERRQFSPSGYRLLIAVSNMVANDLCERHGVPRNRIRVLYNPVDARRFAPGRDMARASIRERFGIGESEYVALFVGHHFRLKGLDACLRAVSKMGAKAPRLMILGNGKMGRYRRMAMNLCLRDKAVFAGASGSPEDFYSAADVFVLPTFYDPCSLTVLEAMAAGLPVVTSRYNGASELIRDGVDGCVLADPADHGALAGLLDSLSAEGVRAEMGARAREKALTLDQDEHAAAVARVYSEACG